MMDSDKASVDYIGLNVGGKIYQTSCATLTRYSNSLFGSMLEGSAPPPKDDQGNFLIDRDGEMFRHVLNFLRYGRMVLPEEFSDFHLLEREADFFELGELKMALKDMERANGDVGLNVGGKIYRTSGITLTSVPNSFFQDMLHRCPPAKDDQGNYLIDQDGEIFRHVLNFLRSGELVLPEGFNEFDLLEREAEFFKLEELQKMVMGKRVRMVGYVINGQVFKLRREDALREKDSLFATMLGGEFQVPTDPEGNYIIERSVEAVHYLIHYIKHGGIFKDMTYDEVKRLKSEADMFRLYALKTLHLKSIEAAQAQGKREDESIFLHIIFDHRQSARCVHEPCVVYTNKAPSFFGTNADGHLIRDFFRDGKVTQCAIGSSSMTVGQVDVQKIKQGDGRIELQDFVSYFSTRMPGSVDTLGSCGYFTLLKVTILLNST